MLDSWERGSWIYRDETSREVMAGKRLGWLWEARIVFLFMTEVLTQCRPLLILWLLRNVVMADVETSNYRASSAWLPPWLFPATYSTVRPLVETTIYPSFQNSSHHHLSLNQSHDVLYCHSTVPLLCLLNHSIVRLHLLLLLFYPLLYALLPLLNFYPFRTAHIVIY